jgi:hypothetical protein
LEDIREEAFFREASKAAAAQEAAFGAFSALGKVDATEELVSQADVLASLRKLVEEGSGARVSLGIAYPYAPAQAIIPLKLGNAYVYLSVSESKLAYYYNMISIVLGAEKLQDAAGAELVLGGTALVSTATDLFNMARLNMNDYPRKGVTFVTPEHSALHPSRWAALGFGTKTVISSTGEEFKLVEFMPANILSDLFEGINQTIGLGKENPEWKLVRPDMPGVYQYGIDESEAMKIATTNDQPERYGFAVVRGRAGDKVVIDGQELDAAGFVYIIRIDYQAKDTIANKACREPSTIDRKSKKHHDTEKNRQNT